MARLTKSQKEVEDIIRLMSQSEDIQYEIVELDDYLWKELTNKVYCTFVVDNPGWEVNTELLLKELFERKPLGSYYLFTDYYGNKIFIAYLKNTEINKIFIYGFIKKYVKII